MTTGKTIALARRTFVDKVMSLLFNMLSRLFIIFLPRGKRLLISWLQSHLQWFWSPEKIKSAIVSTVFPSICHEVMGPNAMILVFWMLSFKPTFLLPSFTFIKRLFSSSSLSAINETKPCRVGPPKMDGSWWRGLTECGPLEKGMANHFSILALRTPWTVRSWFCNEHLFFSFSFSYKDC